MGRASRKPEDARQRGAVFTTFLGLLFLLALWVGVPGASAHRSGCHRWHTCPSDHATYWWRSPTTGIRWLCVKPSADERTSAFRRRIVFKGYVYYCHR
jgi:hypothetical protein